MDVVNLLQWPAMVVTIYAAWLVASSSKRKRNAGFWLFLLSNALWVVWGVHVDAPALITMQIGLAAMNIRGAMKSDVQSPGDNDAASASAPAVKTGR